MKHFIRSIILSTVLLPAGVYASNLDAELNSLALPANRGLVSATDKLYAIQSRFSPLAKRHEFAVSLGKNFNQDGHLDSNQLGGLYRYHINDKWALGANYYRFNNKLSSSGQKLLADKAILPDRDYVKAQSDLLVEYNLFYGKLRLGLDEVAYFDQYLAFGASQLSLGRGTTSGAVVDLGVAFWIGKSASARLGLKNDFYKEQNFSGSTDVHSMVGHLSFGYLLGGAL